MVRVRKLVLAIAAASALTSGMAHALGLGEISLRSSLNQPLDAEIELLEVRDLGNGEVIPSLAAAEEFSKVGVDRPFFLTDLKFTPVLKPNGKSVIRVTSSKPVREPYLNFLVEVLWPNGRLLREYTVLLDPPLYSPQTVAAAAPRLPQAAPLAPPVPQLAEQPRAPRAEPSVAQPPSAASAPLQDGQYRVGRNDTLWVIAERARPTRAVSVHQTMLAIQDLNPDAFFDGNINLLKNGQVLRLPSEEQIRSRSQADALAQVQAQNVAWREGRTVQPVASGRQLDATRRSQAGDAPAQAPSADNLRLVSADAGKSTSGSDNGAAGDGRALADKLALNQESLTTAQRENQELKERLSDLQSQLDKLQRLIELKNEQMAKLQGGLAVEAPAPAAAGAPAAPMQPAVDSTPVPVEAGKAAEQPVSEAAADAEAKPAVAAAAVESQAPVEAAAANEPQAPVVAESQPVEAPQVVAAPRPAEASPKPAPKPAPQPVAPVAADEPSLLDEMLADPLLLGAGGGALALLAGLGLLVNARRKKQAIEAEGESFDDLPGEPESPLVATAEEAMPAERAPSMVAGSLKSSDPLAEAEMYSTYGRFTQAAELLRNAINEEPQRVDLRIKLMEVCAEMGDREGFVRQEAELGEIGGAQPQIDQLRARYPQILASAAAIAIGTAAGADAFDFSEEATADKADGQSLDEFSLDDLTLDDPRPDPAARPEAPAVEPAEGFDLSLDDLEAELERELTASPQVSAEAPLALDEPTLEGLGDDLLSLDSSAVQPDAPALDFDLQLDALELSTAEASPLSFAASEGDFASALDEEPFAELDQLVLDHSQLTDETMAGGQDEQALFAELDRLDLDDALLAEEPAEVAATGGQGEEPLFVDLDRPGLGDELLAEASVPLTAAQEDGTLFAELDRLSLDDPSLMADAEVPQVAEEEPLAALADLELADAQLSSPAPVAGLQPAGLDTLELELQTLGGSSEAEQNLDAAFDEFLAQSGVAEFAEPVEGKAELPSLDDLVIEPMPVLSGEEDFNFLDDTDETATKLELARAYIDMGDADGARDILDEVLKEGSANQQQEAREMMGRIA